MADPEVEEAAARRGARVAWALAEELNRRLYGTLEQIAVNAFGSVRQRVAVHLLDLASSQQHARDCLVARVTQRNSRTRWARSARSRPGSTPSPAGPEGGDFSYAHGDKCH